MENSIDPHFEEDYKEKISNSMKENLIFSIIAYLWNKSLELDSFSSDEEREKFQKMFIKTWKKNINEITQSQLKEINSLLNENNIDMLNIITGKKEIADIEDYQQILNKTISDTENIFWKICGK